MKNIFKVIIMTFNYKVVKHNEFANFVTRKVFRYS